MDKFSVENYIMCEFVGMTLESMLMSNPEWFLQELYPYMYMENSIMRGFIKESLSSTLLSNPELFLPELNPYKDLNHYLLTPEFIKEYLLLMFMFNPEWFLQQMDPCMNPDHYIILKKMWPHIFYNQPDVILGPYYKQTIHGRVCDPFDVMNRSSRW